MYEKYNVIPSTWPTFGQARDCCIKAFDYNGLLELTRQNSIADIVNAGASSNSLVVSSVQRMKKFQRNRQLWQKQAELLNGITLGRPIMVT